MTDARGYIKGLTRFNYWNYPAINPDLLHKMQTLDMIGTSAHQYLSDMYRRDYEAGTLQAIFEYAKADGWAFRSSWVVTQIEAWRFDNTPESRKKLHKLMRAYTDDRGKDRLADTVEFIKQDQGVYKAIMIMRQHNTSLEHCFAEVAPQYHLGTESVRKVYRHYQQKIDELMGKPPSRPVRKSVDEHMASIGAEAPAWDQWTIPDAAATWQEALQRLEAMTQRLEDLLRMEKRRF
jgi:hypothetical protein